MFELSLVPQVKITDLITSLSVACAASTLIYTWTKDRRLRAKEYGDKIRAAAAVTLSKIDRCHTLFRAITDDIQSVVTEIDGIMVDKKNNVLCRDNFWKSLHEKRTTILQRYEDEEIEIAYAPLLPYKETVYEIFNNSLRNARILETASFVILQERCQQIILDIDTSSIQSAQLGNELRRMLGIYAILYTSYLSETFAGIRDFLREIVSASDFSIVNTTGVNPTIPKAGAERGLRYWVNRWETDLSYQERSYRVGRPSEESGEATRSHAELDCLALLASEGPDSASKTDSAVVQN